MLKLNMQTLNMQAYWPMTMFMVKMFTISTCNDMLCLFNMDSEGERGG